jgi:hypothetical protein
VVLESAIAWQRLSNILYRRRTINGNGEKDRKGLDKWTGDWRKIWKGVCLTRELEIDKTRHVTILTVLTPEDGGGYFRRNLCSRLQNLTVSEPRRAQFASLPPWKPQMLFSHSLLFHGHVTPLSNGVGHTKCWNYGSCSVRVLSVYKRLWCRATHTSALGSLDVFTFKYSF